MMGAEQYVIDHNLGDVIASSFGATENTFPGFAQGDYSKLLSLRGAFADAARRHVTVLAASGDTGATNDEPDGATLYPVPAPSPGPRRTRSSPRWAARSCCSPRTATRSGRIRCGTTRTVRAAAGARVSTSRPGYQDNVASVVGGSRGTPDISMSAGRQRRLLGLPDLRARAGRTG